MFVLLPVLALVALLLLLSVIRGAPFVTSFQKTVERMVATAGAKPGMKSVDLGSGDGRIVIAFAKAGIEAHGFEINPILVWLARRKIRSQRLTVPALIHWKSFWGQDLSGFDIVTLYGTPHIMKGLETKLRRELRVGAKVLSNAFVFPTWRHTAKDGAVYVYEQGK